MQNVAESVDVQTAHDRVLTSNLQIGLGSNIKNRSGDEDADGDFSEFHNDIQSEKKTFRWRIDKFNVMYQMAKYEAIEMIFNAGDSIGIELPTKWKFFISTPLDGDSVNIYLSLVEHNVSESKVMAEFEAYIKKPDGQIVSGGSAKVQDMKLTAGWGFRNWACLTHLASEGILNSDLDSLTIHITFILFGKHIKEVKRFDSKIIAEVKRACTSEVVTDLEKLLQSGLYSDITFQVRTGEKIKGHKMILAARSVVFNAMFETEMLEKKTGVVIIEDLSAETFNMLLKYIYTGHIDRESVTEELLYAAEKYDLNSLKLYIDVMLLEKCTIQNALQLLVIGKRYGLSILTHHITKYIKTNLNNILEVLE